MNAIQKQNQVTYFSAQDMNSLFGDQLDLTPRFYSQIVEISLENLDS